MGRKVCRMGNRKPMLKTEKLKKQYKYASRNMELVSRRNSSNIYND